MEAVHVSEPEKISGLNAWLHCKCPRCRQGDMFENPNAYALKTTMRMNRECPVCGQSLNIEVGFYYGSSYVSYALTVAISVTTFVAWWVVIGFSLNDHRIFYWLIFNSILLRAAQPYLMRIARAGWLAFFVRYNKDWQLHPAQTPERTNEEQEANW